MSQSLDIRLLCAYQHTIMSHLITFRLITSYARTLNVQFLNFSKIISVNNNLSKVVQRANLVWQFLPCNLGSTVHGRRRRLPSGCMWWHYSRGSCTPGMQERKQTQLTWCEPDPRCEDSLSAGPCQMKRSKSVEHTSCPEIPALTSRPSSGNKTLKFMCFRFSISPGLKSCKKGVWGWNDPEKKAMNP